MFIKEALMSRQNKLHKSEKTGKSQGGWDTGTVCSNSFQAADFFRRLALAWLTAATIEYILLPVQLRSLDTLTGLSQMSLIRLLTITVSLTLGLHFLPKKYHPPVLERWMVVGVFAGLSFQVVSAGTTIYFTAALIAIICVLTIYAIRGSLQTPLPAKAEDPLHAPALLIVFICALVFIAYIGGWGLCRALSFGASTYDLGIFAQMFHSMKTSGLPMTTLERGYLLSHFDVHMSPIYYLLLPIYCLMPGAHTLNLLQAVILATAVIPLWKLCRSCGLSGVQSMLVCLVLLLAPAYSGGTSYDFHENAFLTPLILWLFYGIQKKSSIITAVFSVLTLMVKEDSAVYVAVIGLWLLADSLLQSRESRKWGLIIGSTMLLFSVAYFLGTVTYLSVHGDGVMTYRYKNLMFDGSGSLLTVVQAALLSPMKVLYECLDSEKLSYILQTMGILLCLPVFTRRFQRYILLIPYLLINLVSDYSYQHNIFFQYSFGSLAFLLYLTVVNLADLKGSWKRVLSLLAVIALSCTFLQKNVVSKAEVFIDRYTQNQAYYEQKYDVLSSIPADASVAATTYLTVPLSQREEIYDILYAEAYTVLTADYVVIQCNDSFSLRNYAASETSNGYAELISLLEEHGYIQEYQFENNFVIYRK